MALLLWRVSNGWDLGIILVTKFKLTPDFTRISALNRTQVKLEILNIYYFNLLSFSNLYSTSKLAGKSNIYCLFIRGSTNLFIY